jgi:hypothetical protein
MQKSPKPFKIIFSDTLLNWKSTENRPQLPMCCRLKHFVLPLHTNTTTTSCNPYYVDHSRPLPALATDNQQNLWMRSWLSMQCEVEAKFMGYWFDVVDRLRIGVFVFEWVIGLGKRVGKNLEYVFERKGQ